ncbi:MAG: Pimeloyl-ACP methyl ester carboxylesterase [Chitinophagaceae bacterium]|nr:Pimeloyl-ACP methyl ester carboxylesterase [Chitinophagaceae bacterium]
MTGYWRGAISRDGAVQILEMNLSYEKDSLLGTYNLPDLGLFEEPLQFISRTDSALTIRLFAGQFNCIMNSSNMEITGENKNWKPVAVKLHVKR